MNQKQSWAQNKSEKPDINETALRLTIKPDERFKEF